ncbi:alkanesulfonate monooxygenase SsuD/methylene tetrahydromethanopterin reductase-like flavin-dependent oxidoreductase (luciferase family) [Krasilnikovia cinnamomea]|uniref:Alkanesulfonate monooxygenase SsuD/methylene tetrahydromethanopterin reductase-like flavin-dependent oxidoreductase (Luciferase family) n=1 Tax=Krasilnikovia cinnamomea TaxID=349313 RepID=A0A4Q7ZSS6_9ACTN|nr:LLM class flavin-dependent oxidoreductase [Krasilnikovia cinnamomea]RZU53914.1 alkanesulfonate monooxygenase SsuD/methylene tetrahydromethanopterin reductase-like flavin-dependent oxidoreductase (luciferase family) [Krasilnikovia cinnamomea]
MSRSLPLRLAVALNGAGWHPAAWREPTARPADLFTAGYWTDLVREAEHGLLDFVTIEDALGMQSSRADGPDERTDQVRGRLDAVQIAARIAPLTRHVGLIPTATVTHTEPFHVAKAIATLDYVSAGRAGWQVQVSELPHESAHFGRRVVETGPRGVQDLLDEAADYVEVVRRLWDSWEDDAEIRDAATGRFIDRDKLHYIGFTGRWFSVQGPSITPRPPQGQPPVGAPAATGLAARAGADVVFTTPRDTDDVRDIVGDQSAPHVFADLVVVLDGDAQAARAHRRRLDDVDGAGFPPDAAVFAGTPGELADRLLRWHAAGLTGVRLLPARLPADLRAISRGLVPELQTRGAFRHRYEATTLRGLLGLPRPANRYAEDSVA